MPWGVRWNTYFRHVPTRDREKYRSRKCNISVYDLAVYDRDMNFIYALTGWEGSTAYTRVLKDALNRDESFKVPRGCYYLCDNGYANIEGILIPYRRARYHKDAWDNCAGRPESTMSCSIGGTLKLEMSLKELSTC